MGKIPEAELKRLKMEVDLVELVQASGVKLKRQGKNWKGCCPFHDDKTPSLVVTPSKNLFHCMGACGAAGSVIDWVMKVKGVTFLEAVKILSKGKAADVLANPAAHDEAVLVTAATSDADILRTAIDHYHATLQGSEAAKQYLDRRGINHPEAIAKFKIGFADSKLNVKRPSTMGVAGVRVRAKFEKLGLIHKSGHEHFAGSIVIPTISLSGEVTEIYGRKVNQTLREGVPDHTYLTGPRDRGVWNPECFESKDVILTEAHIDALTFWVNGFKNVTTSYGTNGFTPDHLKAFTERGVRRVYIAYDRDKPGDNAAENLAVELNGHGIECWRVLFPKGMDANEYACKMRTAAPALRVCLQSAELMGQSFAAAQADGVSSLVAAAETALRSMCAAEPVQTPAAVPASTPAATPDWLKPPKPVDVPCEMRDEDLFIMCGAREYRVRGLSKNLSTETLRVNLRVGHETQFHVDQLDLYHAKARAAFIGSAAHELSLDADVIKGDVGRVLYKCEQLQRDEMERRKAAGGSKVAPELTVEEKKEAMALLKSPDLLDRIIADFDRCGVVGEKTNKCVGYLAAVSRKLDEPLAIVIQSSSAAGKSSLMDAVLAMVPAEDRIKFSAMTGQSLYYIGETSLQNRILAIAEEEGASRASYALKILQSEKELNIAATGKDPASGRIVTQEYRAKGPVMIMLTTTAIDLDEELMNRCLVLTVDEDREQTRLIHERQREGRTLAGMLARQEKARILKLHQNAQRLLRPIRVINPYALTLTFQNSRTRMRRDHKKYLTLIDAIALVHQHQRQVKEVIDQGEVLEYIEVEPRDVEIANELCHEILGRSLDELSPQTRRLLVAVSSMVTENCQDGAKRADFRFTRKHVRDYCGWSNFQVHAHITKLVELEYVIPHRGARGSQFVYELMYDGGGADGKPVVMGLIDSKILGSKCHTGPVILGADAELQHQKEEFLGSISPQLASNLPPCRYVETQSSGGDAAQTSTLDEKITLTSHQKDASALKIDATTIRRAAGGNGDEQ